MSDTRNTIVIIEAVVLVTVYTVLAVVTNCNAPGCNERVVENKKYCMDHLMEKYEEDRQQRILEYQKEHENDGATNTDDVDSDEEWDGTSEYNSEYNMDDDNYYNDDKYDSYSNRTGNRKGLSYHSGDEWPDCDDYDSREEFLDDWEGELPGGYDADDYWDEW